MRGLTAGRVRCAARRTLAVLGAALSAASCGHDEGWLACHGNQCVQGWTTSCRPVGSDLLCTLVDQARTDLTADGAWSVSGPAVVGAPGYVRTTGYGEIVVSVAYPLFHDGTHEVGRYLSDPPRTPRPFYWISLEVVDAGDGKPIGGVRFSVLDGYNAGRQGITDERGRVLVEPLLTGEDFTYEAEKTGYRTLTGRYRLGDPTGSGGPQGQGSSPFLNLRLTRTAD